MRSIAIIIVGVYLSLSLFGAVAAYIIEDPEHPNGFYMNLLQVLIFHVILMGLLSEQSNA